MVPSKDIVSYILKSMSQCFHAVKGLDFQIYWTTIFRKCGNFTCHDWAIKIKIDHIVRYPWKCGLLIYPPLPPPPPLQNCLKPHAKKKNTSTTHTLLGNCSDLTQEGSVKWPFASWTQSQPVHHGTQTSTKFYTDVFPGINIKSDKHCYKELPGKSVKHEVCKM